MRNIDFASGYAATSSPTEIHPGDYSQGIIDAQDWSYALGRTLHAYLSEQDQPADASNLREYIAWTSNQAEDIRLRPSTSNESEGAHRALNEANFHPLTKAMLGMWAPILGHSWKKPDSRIEAINASRDAVAIEGLISYSIRQKFVKKWAAPPYSATKEIIPFTRLSMAQPRSLMLR